MVPLAPLPANRLQPRCQQTSQQRGDVARLRALEESKAAVLRLVAVALLPGHHSPRRHPDGETCVFQPSVSLQGVSRAGEAVDEDGPAAAYQCRAAGSCARGRRARVPQRCVHCTATHNGVDASHGIACLFCAGEGNEAEGTREDGVNDALRSEGAR
jgi:hypothetical protein